MHQLVFGIDFQIHFVSLTSLVSIHLLIYMSVHHSLNGSSDHRQWNNYIILDWTLRINCADENVINFHGTKKAAMLQYRYDVILPPWVVRFERNSTAWYRIARRLRRSGRDRNRKWYFNMADVCFSKPEVTLSQPWLLIYVDKIWFSGRFWPFERSDINKCETGHSIERPRPPSWKIDMTSYYRRAWVVRFGRNSAAPGWRRITRQLRWSVRKWNRKYNSNMTDVCFSQTGSNFISAVNWYMSTKFRLLIDYDLLKAVTTNAKPEIVLSGRVRHLKKIDMTPYFCNGWSYNARR